MHSPNHASFWIAVLVGIASGSVGPFILLRRMALVGDALYVATAERLGVTRVAVFDRRPIAIFRPKHVRALDLEP